MTTDAVLDSIDGALRDYATSADAMRWSPHPENVAPEREMVRIQLGDFVDLAALAEFTRQLNAMFAELTRYAGVAVVPFVKLAGLIAHAALAEDRKHRIRCRECNPAGNPPPFPGGTEYNRRRRARARRRRG